MMIAKGKTKRARRRNRKFGEPIGSIAWQGTVETSYGVMQAWHEEPIYKNRREEQSAKAKIHSRFKKHLERMGL